MKNRFFFYNIIVVLLISSNSFMTAQQNSEKVRLIDIEVYEEQKSLIKKGEKNSVESYKGLIDKAQKLLNIDAFSVVKKVGVPPSGDKHDYMSIAPYFWPNPKTADGLPYIRKDGEINPETRDHFTDYTEIQNFFKAVETFSNAFYFSDEKKYFDKNIALLNVWFINEDTRMNPNINFGQYVPGESEGRCFGIIEFDKIVEVIKFLELAEDKNMLDKKTKEGMFNWFSKYINWLKYSKLGKEEATRKNNHGTHYDLQLLSILLYLDKVEEVKNYLSMVTKARIYSQIEPDGSQPLELARTKSFSYSAMNLHAFLELAVIGKKVGVPLWDVKSEDGRSIKGGFQFLLPYLTNEKEWKFKQIDDINATKIKLISNLKFAQRVFKDKSFDIVLQKVNFKNQP